MWGSNSAVEVGSEVWLRVDAHVARESTADVLKGTHDSSEDCIDDRCSDDVWTTVLPIWCHGHWCKGTVVDIHDASTVVVSVPRQYTGTPEYHQQRGYRSQDKLFTVRSDQLLDFKTGKTEMTFGGVLEDFPLESDLSFIRNADPQHVVALLEGKYRYGSPYSWIGRRTLLSVNPNRCLPSIYNPELLLQYLSIPASLPMYSA
eukprot:Lankesteria_metandrocarpae@DN2779_c0_g1_i1.p1